MAAGNVIPYTTNLAALASGGIDLDSDTIVCVLLSAAYTPGRTTHSTYADIEAYDLPDPPGYIAGVGQELTTKAVTHTAGTVKFDADDVVFAASTITAKYAALVRLAGVNLANTDLLIAYVDLNTDSGSATVSSTADAFTIAWNAAGILTVIGNSS